MLFADEGSLMRVPSDNTILYAVFFDLSKTPQSLVPQGLSRITHFVFVVLSAHYFDFVSRDIRAYRIKDMRGKDIRS